MDKWDPSGVITITTDFGHKGPFAAVMQGAIVKRFPTARIIDLAHDIPAHWPPEAGFWLSRSYSYFPSGTVHIAIVDPGVGTERDILLALKDGHLFMAPDNGLLAPLLESADKIGKLNAHAAESIGAGEPSLTFHGRDIFAPIAAELAAGKITFADIATEIDNWAPGWIDDPSKAGGRVSGIVVTVDAFGNLITNIDASLLQDFEKPSVSIAGQVIEMKPTYGRVRPGEYLALINSFAVLEIARSEESAAQGLGCERGAPVVVRENPVI
ncbi:MAG: SAM hydrolase/SAM-dependent halogenase family protein [Woeseiaceae bacterium]